MEGIVLLFGIVQVSCVLVNSIVSVNFLEQFEGPVVSVVVAWSIIEYSDIRVVHLIISHHLEGWSVDDLL